jgi:hypothetical protein
VVQIHPDPPFIACLNYLVRSRALACFTNKNNPTRTKIGTART